MKVRTATASLFAYPDLTIVCEPRFHDSRKDVLINPKVIFEVLSPSTEIYDRTTKFARFRMRNETLTDFILVSQDRPFVEYFTRQPDGNWLYRSFNDLTDEFEIESVECGLSLEEIYDRVEFEPLDEPEHLHLRAETQPLGSVRVGHERRNLSIAARPARSLTLAFPPGAFKRLKVPLVEVVQ